MIKITIEQTRRRVPVIAGTGSNSTAEAIRLTAAAREMGADGALLISPYYNKPTQEGIFRHYKTIAAGVDLPLIVYNIPGRTGVEYRARNFRAAVPRSRISSASRKRRARWIRAPTSCRLCGERLTILSGDDALTVPMMALGAKGVIATSPT